MLRVGKRGTIKVKMETPKDTGVIIGRFQLIELKEEQCHVIQTLIGSHRKVVVFIEVSPVLVTKRNPIDFITRKEMILAKFPELTVLSIPGHPSIEEWSKNLDNSIREACPGGSVVLYGNSRFVGSYKGSFEVKKLEIELSGHTAGMVKSIGKEMIASASFRAGMVFAVHKQYAKVYPTVDVAVFNGDKLLLAQKPSVNGYRFIGGFSDPDDHSYEEAARREVMEEANVEIDHLEYVGSAKVDDWRYRDEEDKITTILFIGKYVNGVANPQDDISELCWFDWSEVNESLFVSEHKPLFKMLERKVNMGRVKK